MKKSIINSLLFLVLFVGISVGEPLPGSILLKVDVGAASAGFGGAYSALAEPPLGVWSNPAGINRMLEGEKRIASYLNYWLVETKEGGIGFAYKPKEGNYTLGLGLRYFSSGNIPKFADILGAKQEGYYNAHNVYIICTYGQSFYKDLFFGINIKLLQEKIDKYKGTTFAIDVGQIYQYLPNKLAFAVSLSNLGPGIKFIEKASKLPTTFKVGIAYSPVSEWLILTDIFKAQGRKWAYALGIEKTFPLYNFSIKGGYNSNTKAIGLGAETIFLSNYILSYSLTLFPSPLETHTHNITLDLTF